MGLGSRRERPTSPSPRRIVSQCSRSIGRATPRAPMMRRVACSSSWRAASGCSRHAREQQLEPGQARRAGEARGVLAQRRRDRASSAVSIAQARSARLLPGGSSSASSTACSSPAPWTRDSRSAASRSGSCAADSWRRRRSIPSFARSSACSRVAAQGEVSHRPGGRDPAARTPRRRGSRTGERRARSGTGAPPRCRRRRRR